MQIFYYRDRRVPQRPARKVLPYFTTPAATPVTFGGASTRYLYYVSRRPRLRRRTLIVSPLAALLLFGTKRRKWAKRKPLRIRARLFQPMAAPVGFVAFKKPPRAKIKRGRWITRLLRRNSIAGPPVGFVQWRPPPRPKIKRRKNLVRQLRRYSIAGPPVGFIQAPPLRRLRLRKLKYVTGRLKPRLFPTMAAPVGFFPTKKFPRPKIKRGKWNNMRFALRFYEFPGVAPVIKTIEWIVKARRRGRR